MKNLKQTLLAILVFSFQAFNSFSQDSVSILSNANGLVQYNIQTTTPNTHVFTLFGDGYFSIQNQPVHKFAQAPNGYSTETYFAKPYHPNLPPSKIVETGGIGTGSTYVNPPMNMFGEVDLLTSWAPAYQFENFFIIAFRNLGQSAQTGCVELHFKDAEINVNTPNIKVYNNWVYNLQISASSEPGFNKKLTWDFSNLLNETRFVYIPANVLSQIGSEVTLLVNKKVGCNAIGNRRTVNFLVRAAPHDPNFIRVNKDCISPTNPEQRLEYTIGFFNDGHYFANDVYLINHLPPLLRSTSANIIDYEYLPSSSLSENQLNISFLNIDLPGTNQVYPTAFSYEDAFSYITYEICSNLT